MLCVPIQNALHVGLEHFRTFRFAGMAATTAVLPLREALPDAMATGHNEAEAIATNTAVDVQSLCDYVSGTVKDDAPLLEALDALLVLFNYDTQFRMAKTSLLPSLISLLTLSRKDVCVRACRLLGRFAPVRWMGNNISEALTGKVEEPLFELITARDADVTPDALLAAKTCISKTHPLFAKTAQRVLDMLHSEHAWEVRAALNVLPFSEGMTDDTFKELFSILRSSSDDTMVLASIDALDRAQGMRTDIPPVIPSHLLDELLDAVEVCFGSENPAISENAMYMLGRACFIDSALRALVRTRGLIPKFVANVETFAEEEKGVYNVLSVCTKDSASCAIAREAGAIDAMLRVFERVSSSTSLPKIHAKGVASCISEMAEFDKPSRRLVVNYVMGLLNSDNTKDIAKALLFCNGMWYSQGYQWSWSALCEAGVIPRLVELLLTGDGPLQHAILKLIWTGDIYNGDNEPVWSNAFWKCDRALETLLSLLPVQFEQVSSRAADMLLLRMGDDHPHLKTMLGDCEAFVPKLFAGLGSDQTPLPSNHHPIGDCLRRVILSNVTPRAVRLVVEALETGFSRDKYTQEERVFQVTSEFFDRLVEACLDARDWLRERMAFRLHRTESDRFIRFAKLLNDKHDFGLLPDSIDVTVARNRHRNVAEQLVTGWRTALLHHPKKNTVPRHKRIVNARD